MVSVGGSCDPTHSGDEATGMDGAPGDSRRGLKYLHPTLRMRAQGGTPGTKYGVSPLRRQSAPPPVEMTTVLPKVDIFTVLPRSR